MKPKPKYQAFVKKQLAYSTCHEEPKIEPLQKTLDTLTQAFVKAQLAYSNCHEETRPEQLALGKALDNAHDALEKAVHKAWCNAYD